MVLTYLDHLFPEPPWSPFGILEFWPFTDPGTQSTVRGVDVQCIFGWIGRRGALSAPGRRGAFSRHDHIPAPPPLVYSSLDPGLYLQFGFLWTHGTDWDACILRSGLASVSDGRHFMALALLMRTDHRAQFRDFRLSPNGIGLASLSWQRTGFRSFGYHWSGWPHRTWTGLPHGYRRTCPGVLTPSRLAWNDGREQWPWIPDVGNFFP